MLLKLDGIKKSFKDKLVLDELEYSFESGKITAILGRNGSGKTTLFNILNGELPYDKGTFYLEVNGSQVPVKREDIGMLYSENFLPEFLTGYEYTKFFMDINCPNAKEKPDDYLDLLGFNKLDRDRLIKSYSHGMKSKISLIGILISRPRIILLDEPLTTLDVVISQEIKKLLLELVSEDRIILLSTHMLELAKDMSKEIALIHHKKLVKFENKSGLEGFDEEIIEALRGEEDA